jgi:hypothetical protein
VTRTWIVTTATSFDAIAWQCGVPADVLRFSGVDPRTVVGEVEAATKGDAIMRARERFPRIPVADLGVIGADEQGAK